MALAPEHNYYYIHVYHQNITELVVLPSLEDYLCAFVAILGIDFPSNDDHGLRKEVIMTLCHLLRCFPQPLTPHIMTVVTSVWNILTQQTTVFVLASPSLLDI